MSWRPRARAKTAGVRVAAVVAAGAVRPDGPLWWVEGDNPAVTDDSRKYGPAEVLGRVVLRYWPLPPSRRLA